MAPIIRLPAISHKKRTLTHPRLRQKEAMPEGKADAPGELKSANKITSQPQTKPASNIDPHHQQKPVSEPDKQADIATSEMAALMDEARRTVLSQFKQEAEAARELGRQRGLQEGRAAGSEEVRQNFITELARVRSIADQLQHAIHAGLQGMEDIALEIAFETVCKILGNNVITPEGIRTLIRQAMQKASKNSPATIHLNPADLAALREVGMQDSVLTSGAMVSWVPNKTVELGGCMVETGTGILDARLETQINALRVALLQARQPHKPAATAPSSAPNAAAAPVGR